MQKLKKLINLAQTYAAVALLVLGPNFTQVFQKPTVGPIKSHVFTASRDPSPCRELQLAYDNERRKLVLLKIILSKLAGDTGMVPGSSSYNAGMPNIAIYSQTQRSVAGSRFGTGTIQACGVCSGLES